MPAAITPRPSSSEFRIVPDELPTLARLCAKQHALVAPRAKQSWRGVSRPA